MPTRELPRRPQEIVCVLWGRVQHPSFGKPALGFPSRRPPETHKNVQPRTPCCSILEVGWYCGPCLPTSRRPPETHKKRLTSDPYATTRVVFPEAHKMQPSVGLSSFQQESHLPPSLHHPLKPKRPQKAASDGIVNLPSPLHHDPNPHKSSRSTSSTPSSSTRLSHPSSQMPTRSCLRVVGPCLTSKLASVSKP